MGGAFPRAVRSELRKFFTTRLWWGMGLGVFLSGAAFALLFGILLTSDARAAGARAASPPATRCRWPTASTPGGSASATC